VSKVPKISELWFVYGSTKKWILGDWVVRGGLWQLIGGWGWFRVAGWWCFTSDDWAIVSDACICLVSRVVITKKYHFKLTIINTFNLIKIYKLNLQKN
jgi:hypothetical protein